MDHERFRFLRDTAEAFADDAQTLALIHDRELTAALLVELRSIDFPDNLALLPAGAVALDGWRAMKLVLASLPAQLDTAELDILAADFASIYLTAAYGVSPCESTWTDEDHLVCQDSMFQLREIYRTAGLAAVDWRRRPDDHLVLQLAYLAHAVRQAESTGNWQPIASFMDEHLLYWLPDFCSCIAGRCATPFYAALAMLTYGWCNDFRNLLAACLNEPRPSREEVELRIKPQASNNVAPLAFFPGVGPTV